MNSNEIKHHEEAVEFTEQLYDELINRGIKLKPRRYVLGFAAYCGCSDVNDLWIDIDRKDKPSIIISTYLTGGEEKEPYFMSIYRAYPYTDLHVDFAKFSLEKIINDIFTFLDIYPKTHYEQLSLF